MSVVVWFPAGRVSPRDWHLANWMGEKGLGVRIANYAQYTKAPSEWSWLMFRWMRASLFGVSYSNYLDHRLRDFDPKVAFSARPVDVAYENTVVFAGCRFGGSLAMIAPAPGGIPVHRIAINPAVRVLRDRSIVPQLYDFAESTNWLSEGATMIFPKPHTPPRGESDTDWGFAKSIQSEHPLALQIIDDLPRTQFVSRAMVTMLQVLENRKHGL